MVFRTPLFFPLLFRELIWRIPTDEKKIFLTFDDGPVPGPTEFVLEVLKSYQIKATFFCIGDNVAKHPEIFRRVMAEGHAIGNHTHNHLKGWSHTTEMYLANIARCESQFQMAGFSPSAVRLFRPPYGRISPKQIKALLPSYKIVMWDVLTQDYVVSIKPEKCLKGSIHATRSGSIVIFHDSVKASRNLTYTLPRYLDHFSKEGYSFELLPNTI